VLSYTSSPSASPKRSVIRTPTSPEVKTPFRRAPSDQSSPALETFCNFNLEDLSPQPVSQMHGAGVDANARAAEGKGLNSIFGVRPPQPPRHRSQPRPAGPVLQEALEELPEPSQTQREDWRFGDWISFSPLRRVLRRDRKLTDSPDPHTPRGSPGDIEKKLSPCVLGSTPEQTADAGQERALPNGVESPSRQKEARNRAPRGRPRMLDVDLFDEAHVDPGIRTRSNKSTPLRETCLQVACSPPQNELETWTPSMSQTSPYEWRPSCRAADRPSPAALNFAVVAESTSGASSTMSSAVAVECRLPSIICSPSHRRLA
jgi:hypothetical protein